MTSWFMPRLDRLSVDECLFSGAELIEAANAGPDPTRFPNATTYGATGGSPVPANFLFDLRGGLLDIARSCGFPERGGTDGRARFDERAAIYLAERAELASGEALRDDVWAFLTTIVVPDIVDWRFPGRPSERFHGGVRNALQRLWMRARVLDRGASSAVRWELLAEMTEDALVQITERPSIGADLRLARAFAEGWLRMARRIGRPAMEAVMRHAVIRLRLRNHIQLLSELDDGDLAEAIGEFFDQSRSASS